MIRIFQFNSTNSTNSIMDQLLIIENNYNIKNKMDYN